MKHRLLFVFLTLLIFSTYTEAQSPELKETFLEAESYFLFEEYNEALPLYLRLRRANPENNNINYKIGICFLNDPYQKEKSIFYLEEASKDINPKYKENNFKETTAPPETFFYLGNAYLVNNNIDKALENYRYFRSILDEKIYDVELVEEQIRICERARDLKTKPVDYDRINLSDKINSRFSDINPIISGDGNRLVYVSMQQFYDATFFSEKVNGEWQPPRNIIPELGVDGDVYPTSLSWDGTTMIIYRNDDFIGNLYQSKLVDGRWTAMEKLGANINTKYWESHGSLSKDGQTLYFTSNRKDGFGGLDIYKSQLQDDGSWDAPVNLGSTVNTRYNEETPFITENGKILFFSSYGHYNMGGYDVFYSVLDGNGAWSTPINLGYPINTTDDDIFFHPVDNGINAYYSQYLEGGFGRHDIYYLTVYSENNPRMYLIAGILASDQGEVKEEDDLSIFLIDRATGDTIQNVKPDLATQRFELNAPRGEYDLLLQSLTFNDLVKRITIDNLTDKGGIEIDEELSLETKPYVPGLFTGEDSRIIIEDTLITAEAGKPLNIRLRLERGSTLIATHSIDSIVMAVDTFDIARRRFTYELIPEAGTNIIEFEMIEENGDKSLKTVVIKVDEPAVPDVPEDSIIYTIPEDDLTIEDIDDTSLDSIYQVVQDEVDRIIPFASGDLKTLLDSLDVSEQEIASVEELYKFLEDKGIASSAIDQMKVVDLVNNDPEELLKRMVQNSDGDLHEYLQGIDLDEEGIKTAVALIDHLRKAAPDNSFTNEDVDALLRKIRESPVQLKETLAELNTYAQGDLKAYIDTLDLDKEEIYTSNELLDHLIDQVGEAYEPEVMISVLSDMVSDRTVESFVEFLIDNGPPALSEFLRDLDLEKEGILTMADLIAYLIENADKLGLSPEELELLLIELMADFSIAPILDADPLLQEKGISSELQIVAGLLLAGILIFIIFFLRKKKRKESPEELGV